MKIAIMTWFSHENYGTALQAYALQHILREWGNECNLINYEPQAKCDIKFSIRTRISNKIEYYIYSLIRRKNSENLKNRSNKFRKFIFTNCILTESIKSQSDFNKLNKEYDAFICGSDQIWSPNVLDLRYYLDFVLKEKRKISYAPSFGVMEIPETKKSSISKCLNRIEFLSVREEQGAKIISNLVDRKSQVVIDPTLLLCEDQWNKVANDIQVKNKYILCYFLGDRKEYWNKAYSLKKKTGYELVIIPIMAKSYLKRGTVLKDLGPSEFVGLIRNAEIILTDSFHGTIFSINYKKDFYVFKRFKDNENGSQNSRVYNILKKLKLEDRLLDDNEEICNNSISIMSYDEVFCILCEERKNAMNFLESALMR